MSRLKLPLATLVLALSCASPVMADLRVDGANLREATGEVFVMRGVNHAHLWFPKRTTQALKDIAATGANTVRIVVGNGQRWDKTSAETLRRLIRQSKAQGLIVMLEVHDTTGYGQVSGEDAPTDASTLAEAVDYWVEMADVLEGEEDYVLINIGNEPSGNGVDTETYWFNEHVTAIKALRAVGLTHVIVVDGPNWGQDSSGVMRDRAPELLAVDPLRNVLFSVHMYQVYPTPESVISYIDSFRTRNLALIVGEFGPDHAGEPVDEQTILAHTKATGTGYLGWSWSGNGAKVADLDMVIKYDAANLSPWGRQLIDGEGGLRQTAKPAAIFAQKRDGWWPRLKRWVGFDAAKP